ncbi:MAG: hypothetical protein WCG12_10215 [Alcaligenaceae bacterium]
MILRLMLAGLLAAFSSAGFTQVPTNSVKPAQKSASVASKQEVKSDLHVVPENDGSTCMIFALDPSWFRIKVHFFSTPLSQCDEKRFAALTNDSVGAQLMLLYPEAKFRLQGPLFRLADLDLTSAVNSDVDVGKLKFSLFGQVTFNLLDLLKDPSAYQKIREGNLTYLPFKTSGTANLLWSKGATLYELIAPNGRHYTMIYGSHLLRNDKFGINLNNLGTFLNLPQGWRFEKRISDKIFRVFTRQLAGEEQNSLIDEIGNIYVHNIHFSSEDISK